MKGAAALIHGYVALDGLGMTLIRNQRVELIPSIINKILPFNLLISNILLNTIYIKERLPSDSCSLSYYE
jgi:hypothetical protein